MGWEPDIRSLSEDEVIGEILALAERAVSWREILQVARKHGVSANRARKIVAYLVRAGELVELRCRVFATKRAVERMSREELAQAVREALARAGIRKCGRPLTTPATCIDVSVSRSGRVVVTPPKREFK